MGLGIIRHMAGLPLFPQALGGKLKSNSLVILFVVTLPVSRAAFSYVCDKPASVSEGYLARQSVQAAPAKP